MYGLAEKLFYTFSAVILGSAFFVMQPSTNLHVHAFQTQVQSEFKLASVQVIGDKPLFEDVSLVISSVNQFYIKSADAMISMLTPPPSEDDMVKVAQSMYQKMAFMIQKSNLAMGPQVLGAETENENVPQNFMQEEAVVNILPAGPVAPVAPVLVAPMPTPSISMVNFVPDNTSAANDNQSWVNLRDNSTGQIYCVAIFNTEVNRYLGPCQDDYK